MTQPVKRPYNSARRSKQAAATRREILDAARHLFERQGYAATTMGAIAHEAGVAPKTVYVAFESKAGVLRALWNLLLRGDEGEAPVGERAWYREALDAPDPADQLRLNARNSRAGKERAGVIAEVIRIAAPADHELAGLWERIQTDYHANQRAIVESLAAKNALAPGLDVDRATDVLWTLNHPSLWQLLVHERGWTPDEYERWCADTAAAQLFSAPPPPSAGRRGARARG
jgi:AcrR family transcriptional regulator